MSKEKVYAQFAVAALLFGLFHLTPHPYNWTMLLLAIAFVVSVEWI